MLFPQVHQCKYDCNTSYPDVLLYLPAQKRNISSQLFGVTDINFYGGKLAGLTPVIWRCGDTLSD